MNQKHFWLKEPIDPYFESFYDPQNKLIPRIQTWLEQKSHFHLHIQGPHLSGKTHLLYACMQKKTSVFFVAWIISNGQISALTKTKIFASLMILINSCLMPLALSNLLIFTMSD